MKLALNGATTMKADLATDIRAAKGAGFDYLEIWAAKLRRFLAQNTTADLRALFDENNVRPYSINSIEHVTFREGEAREQLTSECEELCGVASEVGCPYVVVVPSPLPEGKGESDVVTESAGTLAELSEIAERFNVALAFEFLGQPACSVQTLDAASRIVEATGRTNVGLVIDSFHFYAGGSTIEAIEKLDAKKLFIFHINDAEDLPRGELEDRHRLLPGLGVLPLKEIVRALKGTGYDRVASVEIFRPEYWERDPFELAREAYTAASRVVGD